MPDWLPFAIESLHHDSLGLLSVLHADRQDPGPGGLGVRQDPLRLRLRSVLAAALGRPSSPRAYGKPWLGFALG